MTREKAIANLKKLKSFHKWSERYGTSMELAIKALKQEPILDKIKVIVDEWKTDSWTDNYSYESMVKIAELFEPQESEEQE